MDSGGQLLARTTPLLFLLCTVDSIILVTAIIREQQVLRYLHIVHISRVGRKRLQALPALEYFSHRGGWAELQSDRHDRLRLMQGYLNLWTPSSLHACSAVKFLECKISDSARGCDTLAQGDARGVWLDRERQAHGFHTSLKTGDVHRTMGTGLACN